MTAYSEKPLKDRKKGPEYSPEVKQKFDGMLDLISEKNVKIGTLVEELALSREIMEKTLESVMPSVRRLVENRIRKADEVLRFATH